MHKRHKVLFTIMTAILIFAIGISAGMSLYRQALQSFPNEGSVIIRTPDGKTYGYFGEVFIFEDGATGKQVWIEMDGFLVDWHPHDTEE